MLILTISCISILVNSAFAALVILLSKRLRSRDKALLARDREFSCLKKHQVDVRGAGLPDMVFYESPPMRFTVGGHPFYVQALPIDRFQTFMAEYIQFMQKYVGQMTAFNLKYVFADLAEIKDMDEKMKFVDKYNEYFNRKEVFRDMEWIIKKVFLQPENNPHQVEFKEFKANVAPLTLIAMLFAFFQYHTGYFIKKKIRSVLDAISRFMETSDTELCNPWKPADRLSNSYGILYPDNPFLPDAYKKLLNTEGGSLKGSESKEMN